MSRHFCFDERLGSSMIWSLTRSHSWSSLELIAYYQTHSAFYLLDKLQKLAMPMYSVFRFNKTCVSLLSLKWPRFSSSIFGYSIASLIKLFMFHTDTSFLPISNKSFVQTQIKVGPGLMSIYFIANDHLTAILYLCTLIISRMLSSYN